MLQLAASLESGSTHPIAKALKEANKLPLLQVKALKEVPGRGLEGEIASKHYSIGRAETKGDTEEAYTGCELRRNGECIALFLLGDEAKAEAKAALDALHQIGIGKLIMLSGDRNAVAKKTADELGMDGYRAELMPADKIEAFEQIISDGRISAYVGDGINDSPVLTRADVGISMGGVGADSAIEASDMVLMNDDLEKLPLAVKLAKRTQTIVKENIYFSILIKAVIMVLAITGMANMWLAIFADVGVSLLATANATRPMLMRK
jgi:ATPase, P-type (transporting), HAD superfamily, subfamily IC